MEVYIMDALKMRSAYLKFIRMYVCIYDTKNLFLQKGFKYTHFAYGVVFWWVNF